MCIGHDVFALYHSLLNMSAFLSRIMGLRFGGSLSPLPSCSNFFMQHCMSCPAAVILLWSVLSPALSFLSCSLFLSCPLPSFFLCFVLSYPLPCPLALYCPILLPCSSFSRWR
jgi:hypothetical protein